MSDTNNIFHVAVDDGYAQTKVCGIHPETGLITTYVMRSSIRPGNQGLGDFDGGGKGLYSTEEGETFTVSKDVESENTQFDGFHVSSLNRVLVSHALVEAGYSGQDVNLITGLPVADYFDGSERNVDFINRKRDNLLKKKVRSLGSTPTANISNVRVGCQAVAAWFDYVLNDDLEERNEVDGGVAIVDIGGRTTDIAVVQGGTSIDHAASGTENIGALDVYTTVQSALQKEFKIKDKFRLDILDQAVRNKTIRMWRKDFDISEIVEQATTLHGEKVKRAIERKLGSAASLEAVVFVGGGAAMFPNLAAMFPNGEVAEDPEFSNAKGLLKFSRLQES